VCRGCVQATDFGLSAFIKPGQHLSDVCGTAFYMAPEVLMVGHQHSPCNVQPHVQYSVHAGYSQCPYNRSRQRHVERMSSCCSTVLMNQWQGMYGLRQAQK
jgi:serine/threonine protein kinase